MSRNKKIQNLASGVGGLGTTPLPPKQPSFAKAVLEAYVKASNTGAHDMFGNSVALSGNTLVVGAPYEDSSATTINGEQSDNSAKDSGAAYVFLFLFGGWGQQAYLKGSNADANDWFGASVAVDGNTLVVGAPWDSRSAPYSGAVYVFTHTNGVWSQEANLKASNPGEVDYFGESVAVSGDVLVVGAPGDSHSAYLSGAVYVFRRTNGVWSQEAYLKASNINAHDRFGASVAVDGSTLVVGAPWDDGDHSVPRSGTVYVFLYLFGAWGQQTYLKASNSRVYDFFGRSVAVDGNTLVVGAPGDSRSAPVSGAVYVFTHTNGVWSQEADLKASNVGKGDFFGTSVAVDGNTLVVGESWEDSSATGINGDQSDNSAKESGAVYVFRRREWTPLDTVGMSQFIGKKWTQQAYLKASNVGEGDFFGHSVAVSGNVVAVGALHEESSATGINGNQADNSAVSSGAVYVYRAK
jgi:RNase P/RNase MRP subunit p29